MKCSLARHNPDISLVPGTAETLGRWSVMTTQSGVTMCGGRRAPCLCRKIPVFWLFRVPVHFATLRVRLRSRSRLFLDWRLVSLVCCSLCNYLWRQGIQSNSFGHVGPTTHPHRPHPIVRVRGSHRRPTLVRRLRRPKRCCIRKLQMSRPSG